LLPFTGHSLLSKAMLDLSSALRLTTVIQERGIQGEGRIRSSAVCEKTKLSRAVGKNKCGPKEKAAVNARWKYGITKPHSLQHGTVKKSFIALVFMLTHL